MSERNISELIKDPDIARAMALLSGAKEEANKIIPGNDPQSVLSRRNLQSALVRELIERSGLTNQNGKSSTDTEILGAEAAGL